MNDGHDSPDATTSGVKTAAVLPNGKLVYADIMHLYPEDQTRWLIQNATHKIEATEPPPFRVDFNHVAEYEKQRFEDDPDADEGS